MTHHVEADKVVVEAQGIFDVGHVKMDVAHLRPGRHGFVETVVLAEVAEQFFEVDRVAA